MKSKNLSKIHSLRMQAEKLKQEADKLEESYKGKYPKDCLKSPEIAKFLVKYKKHQQKISKTKIKKSFDIKALLTVEFDNSDESIVDIKFTTTSKDRYASIIVKQLNVDLDFDEAIPEINIINQTSQDLEDELSEIANNLNQEESNILYDKVEEILKCVRSKK